jgi:hypothetical protein
LYPEYNIDKEKKKQLLYDFGGRICAVIMYIWSL